MEIKNHCPTLRFDRGRPRNTEKKLWRCSILVQWTFDTSRKLTQNMQKKNKNWEKFVFIFDSAAEKKVFQTQ